MTDEELIARLREDDTDFWHCEAADRIEALVRQVKDEQAAKFKMRDERDAAKIAASNYADFNHTWRKRAERLEAALRELRHRWYLGDLQEKDFAAALPDIDTFALENSNE